LTLSIRYQRHEASQSAISFYSEVAYGVTEVALKINTVNYETLTQVP
jgi:hypothetical protein